MKKLSIPIYQNKSEAYKDLDLILSYIAREDIYLAHFKTSDFIQEEMKYNLIDKFSIRNSSKNLSNYEVPIMPGLVCKLATCIFSENSKTLGLNKHIHLPKTKLPTITVGKKVYQGEDEVTFNFYRKNAPSSITLDEDFVLRFDSSKLPHGVSVASNNQSIWLFIVLEYCENINLEKVKSFYNCTKIYDYQTNK